MTNYHIKTKGSKNIETTIRINMNFIQHSLNSILRSYMFPAISSSYSSKEEGMPLLPLYMSLQFCA